MKPQLKAPGTRRLKVKFDEPPSKFAFNFDLRHCSEEHIGAALLQKASRVGTKAGAYTCSLHSPT
jgi:hypothetical protein